jgi:hypothetical protein
MRSPPGTVEPPPPANAEDLSNPARDEASSGHRAEAASEASPAAAMVVTPPDGDDGNATGDPKTATAEEDQGAVDFTPEPSPLGSAIDTPVMVEPTPTETIEPTTFEDNGLTPPPDNEGPALGDATSWLGLQYGPEPKPEPDRPSGNVRSRSRVKVFGLVALCLILAAALAFGGIRLFDKNTKPAGRTQTTQNTTTPTSTHPGHVVPPISTAQLTQYEGYAQGLQNGNLAATLRLDKAGTTPTPAQLVLVVIAYEMALTKYNNELRYITWPTSMQSAIDADQAQLRALLSFLQSFSIVQPSGVSAWLTQLHNRTSTAQNADNQVRQDLGLPRSFSFP